MSRLQLLWPATEAGFPPAIVLNMPDQPERLAAFIEHNQQHLKGDVYLLSGGDVGFARGNLKKGTLGNIESHRVAAMLALQAGWQYWFVFEDDVRICPEIKVLERHIVDSVSDKIEMVVLIHDNNPFRLSWLLETIRNPNVDVINMLPYPTLAYHFGPCMVAAMMYSRKGAEAAMRVWSGPQAEPSDNSLAKAYAAGKLRVAVAYENYVGVDSPHAWVKDGGLPTTV